MKPSLLGTIRSGLLMLACALSACGGSGHPASSNGGSTPAGSFGPVSGFTLTPTAIKSFHFRWNDTSGETHYRLLEDPDGASGYTPIAELPANTTQFDHPTFLPDRVNARYRLQACQDQHCIDAAELGVSDRLVPAIGFVKASDPANGDLYGTSLALSANGRYLAVGSPGYEASNSDSGSVYVFARQGTAWQQRALLQASAPQQGDGFGASLSLSSEGDTLAVGAPRDGALLPLGGTVHVFTRTGDSWGLQQVVNALNADQGDSFGAQVALSGDGETLAVGAPYESGDATTVNGPDNNNRQASGAAYVFGRLGGTWTQQAYVKAFNAEDYDNFGFALALSADGQTLAVGAPSEDSAATGIGGDPNDGAAQGSGAVYVFGRNVNTWVQRAYVKASNTSDNARFGAAVALSADAQVMAIGSPFESSDAIGIDGAQHNTAAFRSGAAYVFVQQGSQWSQSSYLKASNTDMGDRFGISVALSGDGSTLVTGAMYEGSDASGLQGEQGNNNASSSGAAYVFRHTVAGWRQQAYVKPSNTDGGGVSQFGYTLALSGSVDGVGDQGLTLAVGAPGSGNSSSGVGGDQSNADGYDVGAVYLY